MHATTRFNGFGMIHKALRMMLFDTATTLQHTDYCDANGMDIALEKIEHVVDFFDEHADHEDTEVLPVIADAEPALWRSFEEEHITDRQLGQNLKNAIASYRAAQEDETRSQAGYNTFYAFNAFIAFNLNHLNKEETELNQVLWRLLSDEEIMAINGKIAASVPPQQAAETYKWMMRGCNNKELISFIKTLQAHAPALVLAIALGIAETELTSDRLERVRAACGIGISA